MAGAQHRALSSLAIGNQILFISLNHEGMGVPSPGSAQGFVLVTKLRGGPYEMPGIEPGAAIGKARVLPTFQ